MDEDQKILAHNEGTKSKKESIYSEWILDKFDEDPVFRKFKPDHVCIGIFTSKYTLIPVPFYEEKYKQLYLSRQVELTENLSCYVDSIVTRDYIKLIYAVPFYVDKISRYFGVPVDINHILSSLVHSFYAQYAAHRKNCLLIHTRNDVHALLLFEQGKLRFSNIYQSRTHNDFFYYISLVLSRFKVNPEKVEVFLSGEILQRTPKYKWLKKHLPRLQFVKMPARSSGSRTSQSFADHQIYDILAQALPMV